MHFNNISAFIIGFLFSTGLVISQMVDPLKVLNFLDITGNWDPSLMLVMITALLVYWFCYFIIKPRLAKPVLAADYKIPTSTIINTKLLGGAILFGLGWGLTGLCPGPAIANLAGGTLEVLLYVTVMCFTMFMVMVLTKRAET